MEIIEKIKSSNLVGRGGAGYPTGPKWEQMYLQKHKEMYMVINGSEGEPGTKKDGYILKNHLDELIEGIKIAYKVFPNTLKIYVYLRKDYFDQYHNLIEEKTRMLPVIVFKEPGGYLCGENTVLINSIEGKRFEPRRKPPYCSEVGLWGLPTLVNNLETYFRIAQIIRGVYKNTRFYSLNSDLTNEGVFDLPIDYTIAQVLKITNNQLTNNQFIQVGGGASGKYFLPSEIEKQSANIGTGAMFVYDSQKIGLIDLMIEKLDFLMAENCGKCTPCREGVFRLMQLAKAGKILEQEAIDVIENMLNSSFCGLGVGAGESFTSLWEKKDIIWKK
jgi:NADH:ubiquinone oxidoreductase subunit F (NADH-binding)